MISSLSGRTARDTLEPVTEIPAQSSVDFLEAAFGCYAAGRVFCITRAGLDLSAYFDTVIPLALPVSPRLGWARLDHSPQISDAPAQIVFTSGTEGRPKPIILSHRNLADVVTRLNAAMEVTGEIREYIGVPVTYSFGLGRARAVAAAGGAVFLPHRFDPVEIRTMLEAGEINALSAVPSLWQTVLQNPDAIGAAGTAVRWIEIGSQYMSGPDKAAMKRLFPNACILQHYGLTEASRSTFLDISATEGMALESVGAPVGSTEIRISEAGEICIRGAHVALGQLDHDGRVKSLTDESGWLVTKDRGELRDGLLYYLGRLDDQINVSGIKLAAEALEEEIWRLVPAAQGHVAAVGQPDELRGEIVLLGVEAAVRDLSPLIEAAAGLALERRGIPAAGGLRLLPVDVLPRTETNKLQRRRLRDLVSDAGNVPADPDVDIALTDEQAALAETWRRVVPGAALGPENSFYDAGGDSLSGVQVGLMMEAAGYSRTAVRATLAGRSLSEVAALDRVPEKAAVASAALSDQTVRSWAIAMVRGLMVIAVLGSHWSQGLFGRLGLVDLSERIFSVFFRIGTPGFAMVFGIGIGAFMVPAVLARRDTVLRRTRMSFWLVLSGIVLGAIVDLVRHLLEGGAIDGRVISFAFYSVLVYYALALLAAPLWLPPLARLRRPVLVLPFLALGLWSLWQLAILVVWPDTLTNLLELPRLMTIAGYSVFKMSALVCAGLAAGIWLSRQNDLAAAAAGLVGVGGAAALLGYLTILQVWGISTFAVRIGPAYTSLPGLVMYAGLALLLTGAALWLVLVWDRLGPLIRLPLQVLIAFGGLALPVYVFHGLVLPLRDILVLLGLGGGPALALPMGLFMAGLFWGLWRLYRMYFGRS